MQKAVLSTLVCAALTAVPTTAQTFLANGVQSAKVVSQGGIPTLLINGQAIPPLMFVYQGLRSNPLLFWTPEAQLASAHGIHLYGISIASFPWDHGVNGPPMDYSAVDKQISSFLQADPQAVFLLRIGVSPSPDWAPSVPPTAADQITFYDGTVLTGNPSIGSDIYANGFLLSAQELLQHLETSPLAIHILGYTIMGQNTGEWFPFDYTTNGPDYSASNTAGFRSWLTNQYGADANLSKAWGSPVTLAAAQIPLIDPSLLPMVETPAGSPLNPFYQAPAEQSWIDFSQYTSYIFSQRILAIAAMFRTATQGKRLIGFYNGYNLTLPSSFNGHLAIETLIASPNIDFIASPISYDTPVDRMGGGPAGAMGARDSIVAHGKIQMAEDDLRTWLAVASGLPDIGSNGSVATSGFAETNGVLQRNFAAAMVHRSGTWWMDLNEDGAFNENDLWPVMSNGLGFYNKLLGAPTPYLPDVALVVDPLSIAYEKNDVSLNFTTRDYLKNALGRTGTAFGVYLLEDFLSGVLPPCKVYIFANPWYLTDAQIAVIQSRLYAEGSTAIWQYAPGYLGGPNGPDPSRVSRLTGITLGRVDGANGTVGSGVLSGYTWGASDNQWVVSPRLAVADSSATVLGNYTADHLVSSAQKKVGNYTSIFFGDPGALYAVTGGIAQGDMLRALLRSIGIHIWTDNGEIVHTDDSFLAINRLPAGLVHIHLPAGVAAASLDGTTFTASTDGIDVNFNQYQTHYFSLQTTAPLLSIAKTHTGSFIEGQSGAAYSVTVSNAAGAGTANGVVTVTETVPSGLTLVSMSGTGWTCPIGGNACTRSDWLAGGATYPAITVTVNVASNAASPLTNLVTVSGGGSASANAMDSTTILGNSVISGKVTVSGVGLSGVTINVNGSTTTSATTDASGNYSITLPDTGAYTLAPARAGYSFNAAVTFSNLSANQTANFSGIAVAGLEFYPVTPCRVADTRTGAGFTGSFGPPSMAANTTRTFPVPSSSCGIPSTAAAYSFNVTVVPPGPLGVLTIWPAGQAMPNASTLNSYTGTVVANAAIVPAGTNGAINVYVNNATDVLFDINGYFAPPTSSGLQFYPVTPCRVADTRTGTGFAPAFGWPWLAAGTPRSFPIPSSACSIPATAAAYSFNFTVIPFTTLGYLTAWPTGKPMPNASTLNSYTGTVVANAAIVPAGTGGAISLYANDNTDVIIDIDGYFAPPGTGGLQFYPVVPCRIADTRTGAGFSSPFGPPSLVALAARSFPIPSSTCEIPSSAGAYSFNFTVVPQIELGLLITWPTGQYMPNSSTLNSYNGTVVANAAIVPAGTGGAISVYVNNTTDVLFDINGYFSQ